MEELQAFYDKLERHDWFYHYSDDSRAYGAGQDSERKLKKEAAEKGVDFEILFKEYHSYVFSGPMYGDDKKPKPERPGGPKPKADTGPF